MASFSATRFGDGLCQLAMWKYMGPDYVATGHVRSAIIIFHGCP